MSPACEAPILIHHVSRFRSNANYASYHQVVGSLIDTVSRFAPPSTSRLAMPTFLSIALSLFGLFLVRLLLGIRRVARNVGSV